MSTLLAGLAAAIPVIHSTVDAVRAGWVPAGDDGIIATRGWDVLSSHTPLVGQYSEAGLVLGGQIVHSPGPMLYWLIALPARYGSVASIAVAMCAFNTLMIVICVALARRRGGVVLMLAAAAAIALMIQSLPTEGLHDIWNPAAGLFPFLALLFACWSLACGDYALLPLVALLASFVVQTHLMYALPTAAALAVGLGGLAARRRSRRVWPWALAALVLAAACWAPPAIDELEHHPGNLTLVARTVTHSEPTLGSAVGWHALVRAIGARPWWLYVPANQWERKYDVLRTPTALQRDSALALLAALVLVCALALPARRFDLSAAAAIGLGMCAAIYLQAAHNPSVPLLAETLGYTLWWGSELGMWVWLVLAYALWLALARAARPARAAGARALRRAAYRGRVPTDAVPAGGVSATLAASRGTVDRVAPAVRPVAAALATLAAIAGVAAVGEAVARTAKRDTHAYEYRPIAALAAGLQRAVPPGRTIEYRLGPLDIGTQPMEPAIRFLLVRHGDRVLARGSLRRLGPYYELYRRPTQWTVYITDGARPQPHMQLAARVRFRSPWAAEVVSAWVRPHAAATQPRRGGAAPASPRPRRAVRSPAR